MNKKTKLPTVSDFRLQLAGANDSPFTRTSASETRVELECRDRIVIDFSADSSSRNARLGLPLGEARGGWGEDLDGPRRREGPALFAFEEHAHAGLCGPSGVACHNGKELALANNALHLSLLRFDVDNALHHFRGLRRPGGRSGELFASAGFFARRFDSWALSTTLQSRVAIEDFEAGKTVSEWNGEGVTNSKAWDELYGVFTEDNALLLYDVRDSSVAAKSIQVHGELSGEARCVDMDRRDHRLLVCTDRATLMYDLRQSAEAVQTSKRRSLTYADEGEATTGPNHSPQSQQSQDSRESQQSQQSQQSQLSQQSQQPSHSLSSSLHCSRGFLLEGGRAVVADFVERTLDLHLTADRSIARSLFFARQLFDVAHCPALGLFAALLENEAGAQEVAVLDGELSLQRVLPLAPPAQGQYGRLGFVGAEGRLLVHDRHHFALLDALYVSDALSTHDTSLLTDHN